MHRRQLGQGNPQDTSHGDQENWCSWGPLIPTRSKLRVEPSHACPQMTWVSPSISQGKNEGRGGRSLCYINYASLTGGNSRPGEESFPSSQVLLILMGPWRGKENCLCLVCFLAPIHLVISYAFHTFFIEMSLLGLSLYSR